MYTPIKITGLEKPWRFDKLDAIAVAEAKSRREKFVYFPLLALINLLNVTKGWLYLNDKGFVTFDNTLTSMTPGKKTKRFIELGALHRFLIRRKDHFKMSVVQIRRAMDQLIQRTELSLPHRSILCVTPIIEYQESSSESASSFSSSVEMEMEMENEEEEEKNEEPEDRLLSTLTVKEFKELQTTQLALYRATFDPKFKKDVEQAALAIVEQAREDVAKKMKTYEEQCRKTIDEELETYEQTKRKAIDEDLETYQNKRQKQVEAAIAHNNRVVPLSKQLNIDRLLKGVFRP